MADVDAEFNDWFNTHQPVKKILAITDAQSLSATVQQIQRELKQAFVHGFARGVASGVARFPPDDPDKGPIR